MTLLKGFALAFLVLILAACQPAPPQEIIEVPPAEPQGPSPLEEPLAVVVEEAPSLPLEVETGKALQFTLDVDDRVQPFGIPVWLVAIEDSQVTLDVDGKLWDIPQTKTRNIVKGLAFTVEKIQYGLPDNPQLHIILSVERYLPGPDEYFMHLGDRIDVPTRNGVVWVELTIVDIKTDAVRIFMPNRDDSLRIPKGESITNMGLKITNLDMMPKPSPGDRYAILRAEAE